MPYNPYYRTGAHTWIAVATFATLGAIAIWLYTAEKKLQHELVLATPGISGIREAIDAVGENIDRIFGGKLRLDAHPDVV